MNADIVNFIFGVFNFIILLKGIFQGENLTECWDLMIGEAGMSPITQYNHVA